MMEKRNFVTPIRTTDGAAAVDDMTEYASGLFEGSAPSFSKTASCNEFEKKSSEEDRKTDRQS